MRSILIALGLALQVYAKVSIGTCRSDIKTVTWADFSTPSVPAPYSHNIGAIDEGFTEMMELVKAFGFSFPIDPTCDDIGKAYPYSEIAAQ